MDLFVWSTVREYHQG